MFSRGKGFLEGDEVVDVGGVVGGGDGEAFFMIIFTKIASVLAHVGVEGVKIRGEVKAPGVGGVEVGGFAAVWL